MSEASKRSDGAGTIEQKGDTFYGKISRADGRRVRIPLDEIRKCQAKEDARATLDAFLKKGRESGKLEGMIDALLARRPRTKHARQQKRVAIEKAIEQERGRNASTMTVKELGEAWTGGALYKEHGPVNGLRPMAGAYEMACTLRKRVYAVRTRGPEAPTLGELPVAQVVDDDITRLMAGQNAIPTHARKRKRATQAKGKPASSQTREHVYNYVSRIFSFAEFPCRLRPKGSNPVQTYHRPSRDPEKHYSYIFPEEFLKFLGCTEIPLARRVLYLLTTYWGMRQATLYSLRWGWIDFGHKTVSALKMKGKSRLDADGHDDGEIAGTPLFFRADPACVLTVLEAFYERCGRPSKDSKVIVADELGIRPEHDEAEVLREDLRRVGVTRELLFSTAPNVMPIRFHDMRATFIT